MQTKNEILERLQELQRVLQFDSQQERQFTPCQRMMINQERAYLFRQQTNPKLPDYKHLPAFEVKLNELLRLIKIARWEPQEIIID